MAAFWREPESSWALCKRTTCFSMRHQCRLAQLQMQATLYNTPAALLIAERHKRMIQRLLGASLFDVSIEMIMCARGIVAR